MDNPFLYQPPAPPPQRFGVVEAVVSGKYRLKIDINQTAGQKLYQYVGSGTLSVGDRVSLQRVSGTYLITGKVG